MNKQAYVKKIREEKQAIGETYKQYIETFQNNSPILRKTFVKANVLYGEHDGENSDYGQFYSPKPLAVLHKPEQRSAAAIAEPKRRTKAQSNLKTLGDELKLLQHERRVKERALACTMPAKYLDDDYVNSTNLFVSNLSPKVNETSLIELFGSYGPLASVKIMWPRERGAAQTANCGFVAFMSRLDAERALDGLKHRTEFKINWGRAVQLPPHPVYIPPRLQELYAPPPYSGRPFNAQFKTTPTDDDDDDDLYSSFVKVAIPFNRNQLSLIHRTIEFVIREGPKFETIMITIEKDNADFSFLWDLKSAEHVYYRWKLFSILNGDSKDVWSRKPFRMFEGGSVWMPPISPNYRNGMPKELLMTMMAFDNIDNENLSDAQTQRLIKVIQSLNASRQSVANAMVFCLNHFNAIDDIVAVLVDAFKNTTTNPVKKIARFYLLSDVLNNCKQKNISAKIVDDNNWTIMSTIMEELHCTLTLLNNQFDREMFKSKVFKVLKSWLIRKYFTITTIAKMENVVLYGTNLLNL